MEHIIGCVFRLFSALDWIVMARMIGLAGWVLVVYAARQACIQSGMDQRSVDMAILISAVAFVFYRRSLASAETEAFERVFPVMKSSFLQSTVLKGGVSVGFCVVVVVIVVACCLLLNEEYTTIDITIKGPFDELNQKTWIHMLQ